MTSGMGTVRCPLYMCGSVRTPAVGRAQHGAVARRRRLRELVTSSVPGAVSTAARIMPRRAGGRLRVGHGGAAISCAGAAPGRIPTR